MLLQFSLLNSWLFQFTKTESIYGFFGGRHPSQFDSSPSRFQSVKTCSGIFYSCAKTDKHSEPILERKFGIKV